MSEREYCSLKRHRNYFNRSEADFECSIGTSKYSKDLNILDLWRSFMPPLLPTCEVYHASVFTASRFGLPGPISNTTSIVGHNSRDISPYKVFASQTLLRPRPKQAQDSFSYTKMTALNGASLHAHSLTWKSCVSPWLIRKARKSGCI